MITRLLDRLAPVRAAAPADRGYRRLLRWAAVPVTNRRWAAPSAALALGFGIFAGVAIGPATSGSRATGMPPIVSISGLGDDREAERGLEKAANAGEASSSPEEALPEATAAESELSVEEPESIETPESPLPEEEEPAAGKPEEEEAAEPGAKEELVPIAGVVVHSNPAAGSYTVAEPSGALIAVHAGELPSPGEQISVSARTLENGTFAESTSPKRGGYAAKAKLEGIVTYVSDDPLEPAYSISKRGVSVLIKVHPDPNGEGPKLPALGAYAVVEVEIETPTARIALVSVADVPVGPVYQPAPPVYETPPAPTPPPAPAEPTPAPLCEGAPAEPPKIPAPTATLWQTELKADGVPFTYSDLAAVVLAVCADGQRLVVSADDVDQADAELRITVPPTFSTKQLKAGDSVLGTVDIAADGGLKLKGLASDERTKGADDAAATQGDLVNHLSE